jgi:RES domain-containing protein
MTEYDRDEVACHLCFQDKVLQERIKEEGRKGGVCPWCGRRGYMIDLAELSESFREVASTYVQLDRPDEFERGQLISDLLDGDWSVFSDKVQSDGLAQDLALTILYADLSGKERLDYPDYEGLFRRDESSLEEDWDERAYAVLTGEMPEPGKEEAQSIERDIAYELPDLIEIAFEDIATHFDAGKVLYRARVHDDRLHRERFQRSEVGAPPPEKAKAGRANREGRPVLYLASSRSTALAEVRAWKGAAVAVVEVTTKRRLSVVDLSRPQPVGSPFFVELLKWKSDLADLLFRLAGDMSRPVMPHEEERLYRPTQLLALLIKSSGYDGFIYPSAMGSGTNIVVFNPDDVEIGSPEYVRVKRVGYFSEPLGPHDDVYEEGPYDFALEKGRFAPPAQPRGRRHVAGGRV